MACAVESVDSVRYEVYFANPDDTPFRGGCFESKYKRHKMARCPHCEKLYRVKDKVEMFAERKFVLACPRCGGTIEKDREVQVVGWRVNKCTNCGKYFLPKEAITVVINGKLLRFCPHCGA
jgi:uncharacterized protein YbaR (Trm112 family)